MPLRGTRRLTLTTTSVVGVEAEPGTGGAPFVVARRAEAVVSTPGGTTAIGRTEPAARSASSAA